MGRQGGFSGAGGPGKDDDAPGVGDTTAVEHELPPRSQDAGQDLVEEEVVDRIKRSGGFRMADNFAEPVADLKWGNLWEDQAVQIGPQKHGGRDLIRLTQEWLLPGALDV